MSATSKLGFWILVVWIIATALPATGGAHPYQQPDSAESNVETPEDVPDDELAPAAVQLDVSNLPALLQELYQATRETKEQQVLARLAHAKELIEGGADLKATDATGRTALHWAIFGSSYHVKPSILVAYEEIADALIQRGVDINKQ